MTGFDSKRKAAQDRPEVDDGDYGGIDEVMHWVTIVILFLMTVVFLAGVAGFVWGDAMTEEDNNTQTYTSESAEKYLYRFGYEAGAAAEREACAKVADGWPDYDVQGLAEAIRARGKA